MLSSQWKGKPVYLQKLLFGMLLRTTDTNLQGYTNVAADTDLFRLSGGSV
jgi:hypothetical protein